MKGSQHIWIQEFLDINSISVSLTTDMWTDRNRQGYLGVTCSFLDKNFTIHEITFPRTIKNTYFLIIFNKVIGYAVKIITNYISIIL